MVMEITKFGLLVDIGALWEVLLPSHLLVGEPCDYKVGLTLKELEIVSVEVATYVISVGMTLAIEGGDAAADYAVAEAKAFESLLCTSMRWQAIPESLFWSSSRSLAASCLLTSTATRASQLYKQAMRVACTDG